jgi:hypothetical protein
MDEKPDWTGLPSTSGYQEAPKEKLLLWAKSKNYPVCQSFANAGGVILALANPTHVDQILSTGQHTIKGSPIPSEPFLHAKSKFRMFLR